MHPILREGVRILRPAEYEQFEGIMESRNKWKLRGLLLSGMRYVEAQRFQDHPEWLEGRFIYLPKGAVLKKEIKMKERAVRLSDLGAKYLPYFLKDASRLPSTYQGFDDRMEHWGKEAGLDIIGLGAKTARKTWESWLAFYYPAYQVHIAQSQGHDVTTQIQHYLNMPFLESDARRMEKWVRGWIDRPRPAFQ